MRDTLRDCRRDRRWSRLAPAAPLRPLSSLSHHEDKDTLHLLLGQVCDQSCPGAILLVRLLASSIVLGRRSV